MGGPPAQRASPADAGGVETRPLRTGPGPTGSGHPRGSAVDRLRDAVTPRRAWFAASPPPACSSWSRTARSTATDGSISRSTLNCVSIRCRRTARPRCWRISSDPTPSSATLKAYLGARTEGNPLFLEEMVRALIETRALAGERGAYRLERSLDSIRVPGTVEAVLAARVDRAFAPGEAPPAVCGGDRPRRPAGAADGDCRPGREQPLMERLASLQSRGIALRDQPAARRAVHVQATA